MNQERRSTQFSMNFADNFRNKAKEMVRENFRKKMKARMGSSIKHKVELGPRISSKDLDINEKKKICR